MSERSINSSRLRLENVAVPLMGALLAVSLAARAVGAFLRAFNRDEFQHLYTGWLLSVGLEPGRDFELPGAYTPFLEGIRVAFRLFPDSLAPLFLARLAFFFLGLLILWAVYAIARNLTDFRPAALLAVLSITFYTEFIRRIGDIRFDALNVLCVLSALLALLQGGGRRPAILAGLALGVGLVSSPKVLAAFGPLLLTGFLLYGRGWVRRSLDVLAGSSVIGLADLLYVRLSGQWEEVWQAYGRLAKVATYPGNRFSPLPALAESLRDNPATILVWVTCLSLALKTWRSARIGNRPAAVAFFAAAYPLVYVIANPAFFSYNFVDIVPVAALSIPAAAAATERRHASTVARLSCLLAILFVATGARETFWTLESRNDFQLRYLDYIRTAVRLDERVFDLHGSHLYRRGPYHWHMVITELPLYRSGKWFSVAEELKRYRISLIVRNYRLSELSSEDWDFINTHYVRAEHLLMFPGHLFQARAGNRQRFEILLDGDYRFRAYRPEGARIDGAEIAEKIHLAAGEHTLEFQTSTQPSFAIVYTTQEREAHKLGARLGDEVVPSLQ